MIRAKCASYCCSSFDSDIVLAIGVILNGTVEERTDKQSGGKVHFVYVNLSEKWESEKWKLEATSEWLMQSMSFLVVDEVDVKVDSET